MLLLFIVGFAMSAGPLIWTLCSEVQPLKGRDFGIGCSTFTNWVANMIVGVTFLSLLNGIGNAATFWLYAALNVVFLVSRSWLVPETKGVTLEEIERKLMAGQPLREIGQSMEPRAMPDAGHFAPLAAMLLPAAARTADGTATFINPLLPSGRIPGWPSATAGTTTPTPWATVSRCGKRAT